jgi:NADH-quinone oxidoreductase subunit M
MLSVLIFLPLAGGLAAAAIPASLAGQTPAPHQDGGRRRGFVSVLFSAVTLGLAIALIAEFDAGGGLQRVTDVDWIPQLGIHYKLGLTGLNLFLIALTALIWLVATVSATLRDWPRPRLFYLMLALGETAVLGAFCAQDLALFVGFFDLMLIPFYFLIGIWGGEGRVQATTKFVIYTLVGSLLMLAAAVATGILSAPEGGKLSFALSDLQRNVLANGSQNWIFGLFALAFGVKMPAFLVHGWMPDAYRAAPTPVVATLSGVLSKVGAYGFLAIVLPLFPYASVHYQELILLVALASILYGSVMAFTQRSATLVVGYSSVAQLGFITLGIFSLRPEGAQGAVLQMVNHGLVVVALFFIIALLAARAGGSDDLERMGGVAFRAPVLAALFLIVALATLAMPGSANFAGEFLILTGVFKAKIVYAIVATAGVAFAAVYAIRLYQKSMCNRVGPNVASREMSFGDGAVIVPIVAVILALALYPQFVAKRSERSVDASVIVPAQQAARNPATPPRDATTPAHRSSAPDDARRDASIAQQIKRPIE